MKGLTTQNEIEILKGIGLENFSIFIQREESSQKWCIKVRAILPDQEEQLYFIERQKGGMRLFAHLEDAIKTAVAKFGNVKNFEIYVESLKFILEK